MEIELMYKKYEEQRQESVKRLNNAFNEYLKELLDGIEEGVK